jgi:Domain of unknown function (DUF4440)
MDSVSKQTLDELLALERTLWDNDAGVYEATYTPDAVLIFPGVGRIDRETAVAAIQKENATGRAWAEVRFEDALARWLATDTAVIISYRATVRWNYEAVASQVLCATVYIRQQKAWCVAFHQQTPASPLPRP